MSFGMGKLLSLGRARNAPRAAATDGRQAKEAQRQMDMRLTDMPSNTAAKSSKYIALSYVLK